VPKAIIGAPVSLFRAVTKRSALGKDGGFICKATDFELSLPRSPLDDLFPSLKNKLFAFFMSLS